MLQGHVLCSSKRQPVCAVVVDQLRDTGEHTAALIQCVAHALNAFSLGHNYVHTALAGPNETREMGTHSITYKRKYKQLQLKVS